MSPFLPIEQMKALSEIQRTSLLSFRYKECIGFARILNMPENQAKLAAGEGVFQGFDPTTDPAYLSSHEYNTIELGRSYRRGYQESGHDEVLTVAQVARGEHLVRPTNRAEEENTCKNQASTVPENDLVNDNDLQIGGKDTDGMDRVKRRKHRRGAAEFMPTSSTSTSADVSSPYSTIDSRSSSTSAPPQTSTSQNKDNSASGASSARTPHVPSYSSINNAKKKKDDGKDFMRTKVKYFDDWSRRMKRAPLPPRSKGSDGKYTMSPYKQKSAAVKALTATENKSLIAFIATKEKALKAVEQAGNADPAMYDDHGMLMLDIEKTRQPKKRSFLRRRRSKKDLIEVPPQSNAQVANNLRAQKATSVKLPTIRRR